MSLTGRQIRLIRDAILAAFQPGELREIIRIGMDERFETIVPTANPFRTQVFELVEWADRNGRVVELLKCVSDDRPRNAALAKLYAEVQTWEATTPPPALPKGNRTETEPPRVEPRPLSAAGPLAEVRVLVARMQDMTLPAAKRLEAGLRAANLGDVPPDLDAFIPVPGHAFRIGKYPITNTQFKRFVHAGGYAPENETRWWSARGIECKRQFDWAEPRYWDEGRFNRTTQPVVGVSWYEAEAYYNWLNETHAGLKEGETARLPTVAEWEAAARGGKPKPADDAQDYPWLGPFRPELANTEGNLGQTTPVHMYPASATPEGIFDLAGNIWEWTQDAYNNRPGTYWLKGGSWYWAANSARASAADGGFIAWSRNPFIGFRVLVVPDSGPSEAFKGVSGLAKEPARVELQPPTPAMKSPIEFDWVTIPAGDFLMGSDKQRDKQAYDDELPQHRINLPEFRISKVPVTNAQYAVFVQATHNRAPKHWRDGKVPQGKEQHPVVYVKWRDARAFCAWASEATGATVRLPSEAEWEKAARGADGLIWPWGDEPPTKERCNFDSNIRDTMPVDAYPRGASPYGVLDMAGNVWEWTSSLYKPYPYVPGDGRESLEAAERCTLRGGAFDIDDNNVRCAYRNYNSPGFSSYFVGFRVASPGS